MSCGRGVSTFRLLDAYTGWDPAKVEHIAGLDDPAGIYLDYPSAPGLDPQSLAPLIPPPCLAQGCEPCVWYLLTPGLPAANCEDSGDELRGSRVMRMGPCTHGFERLRNMQGSAGSGIASAGPFLAVAQHDELWVFLAGSMESAARVRVKGLCSIAFAPYREIIAAVRCEDGTVFVRYSVTGERLGRLRATISGTIDRMAVSRDCRLWVVVRGGNGALDAWVLAPGGAEFEPAGLADLQSAFRASNLTAVGTMGFGLTMYTSEGEPVECFYSYYGRCTDAGQIGLPPPPQRFQYGQLLTLAINSGVPRCRWHRVRIDADVPRGCAVEVAIATSDEESPVPQGVPSDDPRWSPFAAGVPHPSDWQTSDGNLDFLARELPGQYLFVRIRLMGDGVATPLVRRVRLDFERNTSLEHLPAVYRDNPDAEDFTERFLAIFDAQIEEMDDAIAAAPSLLRGETTPDDLMPWLASFLDAGFDQDWGPAQRRQILEALPSFYRKRSTLAGMREVLELVFGAEAVITEFGLDRAFGTVGRTAVVGQTRLFSRGRARFRLGESGLCSAPLNNFGAAREDPFRAQAYRFSVAMPAIGLYGAIEQQRVADLIEAQKPAHTVASAVRAGGDGFFVGRNLALGADTLLAPLGPSVLGRNGTARLNRRTILYSKRPGRGLHLRAGVNTSLACELALR